MSSRERVRYFGVRERGASRVFRYQPGRDLRGEGVPLDLRLDLHWHSPSGPEWGYAGSGAAQLTLAVLADYLGDDEEALELYQGFKVEVIARLPSAHWVLDEAEIARALTGLRRIETGSPLHGSVRML